MEDPKEKGGKEGQRSVLEFLEEKEAGIGGQKGGDVRLMKHEQPLNSRN